MNQTTILVVDDEKNLRDFVRRNLEVRGYEVITAANGLEALALLESRPVHLAILDVMMPHLDGLELTRRIRQAGDTPIILLTALDEESDKVRAFDLGVDDYLTKPFGVGELLGRIKAVLRRAQPHEQPEAHRLIRDDIVLDVENHTALLRGNPLDLTPTEFQLLAYLMKNAGKALTHQMILQQVWGAAYGSEVEYLRVYMGRLRQKIEQDPLHPRHILTEHGLGYRFE